MKKDISTEEKIKEAARKIFHKKGYAGTRTRDIAEEAGINLALLNYYYRSKEKLFELIFEESIAEISTSLKILLNDDRTPLEQKIDTIVNKYINVVSKNPYLSFFILGEIHKNPQKFRKRLGLTEAALTSCYMYEQIRTQLNSVGLERVDPIHIFINVISLTIFPFMGKPLIKNLAGMNEADFDDFIESRRVFIPMWIRSILGMKTN